MSLSSCRSQHDGRGVAWIIPVRKALFLAFWTLWIAPFVRAQGGAEILTLASSPNPSVYGQSVTLNAAQQGAAGAQSGSVTFTDYFQGASVTLAQVPVDATGAAIQGTDSAVQDVFDTIDDLTGYHPHSD